MMRRILFMSAIVVTALSITIAVAGEKEFSISHEGKGVVSKDLRPDRPAGIGSVTVERTAEKWPEEPLILKLHLTGLESLQISVGDTKLRTSILSHGENKVVASLIENGREQVLDKNSPWWSIPKIVAKEPKIPLVDGYFEFEVPRRALEGNPKSFEVRWIDFYRR